MDARILGRGIAFPPRLSDRKRLAMVEADAAIRRSLYLIIYTVPGERVMRPDFGCRIHELIFDPANEETAIRAERFVREAILRWEPRIDLEEVSVVPGGSLYGELLINIVYRHKERADQRVLVYPYYLNPGKEE